MEKRLILAIVLSILVLIVWQAVFIKDQPQPKASPELQSQMQKEKVPPGVEVPAPREESVQAEMGQPGEIADVLKAEAEEHISVDTSLYRAVWNNKGGVLQSWRLKKHRDDNGEDLEIISSRAEEIGKFPFILSTGDAHLDEVVNTAYYKPSRLSLSLQDGQTDRLVFEYADGKSVKSEKILIFEGGRYDFGIEVNVWKDGKKVEPRLLWGPGIGKSDESKKKQQYGGSEGIAVLVANKVYRVAEKKFKPETSAYNFASWAAYEDNYSAALFLFPPQLGTSVFLMETDRKNPYFFLLVSSPERVFIGPKESDVLQEMGRGTKKLVNFGFFGGIAEILLKATTMIHGVIPNWGFAIIVMTIIIKILFFPLTYSSTKSMAKMQELQPKIKALRAKYKKAKQDISQRRQMNEEMMKLYKEHGINPAGGCLPMLIQMPVFWGFFRMLVVAIEFRHSPFIFWIKDLSMRDPFYVTPILMGATQYISQKMMPTSADPTQARLMLIMPFVMTILFMNFQSGLVLYWLTNNVLQIGQQIIMNRLMEKKKRESHGQKRKK